MIDLNNSVRNIDGQGLYLQDFVALKDEAKRFLTLPEDRRIHIMHALKQLEDEFSSVHDKTHQKEVTELYNKLFTEWRKLLLQTKKSLT